MEQTYEQRARQLQVRLYGALGYGCMSQAAEALDVSREHLSRVLNGSYDSQGLLDRVEAWLTEREQQTTAEAA